MREDYTNYLKQKQNNMYDYDNQQQNIFDIISGQGAIRVSVELSIATIMYIFIAFVLAGVVSRVLIK